MTTDTKELMPTLKAAAVRAKTAIEEYSSGRMSAAVCARECAEFNRLTDGPDHILQLIEALEAKDARITELENDEVRQRLANAEHQLYMAELAKNNLRASRMAQFKKRREAELRASELQSRAEAAESRVVTVRLPDTLMPAQHNSGELFMTPDSVECGGYLNRDDVCRILRSAGIQIQGGE